MAWLKQVSLMDLHPIDTRQAFKELRNKSNAHLWYQIHYNQLIKNEKFNPNKKKSKSNLNNKAEKKYILKDIRSFFIHEDVQQLGKKVSEQRLQGLLDVPNINLRMLKAKLTRTIIHGLGAEHVRETSLSIHPVYGFPYIPGSSIKGLVRHWFIEVFLDGDESQYLSSDRQLAEVGREIFGVQDQQGVVQFMDIYMFDNVKISSDIMTPHFSEYYDGKKSAFDTLSPVPIPFYTVEVPEIELLFLVRDRKSNKYPKEIIGNIVANWIKNALLEFGIGAKTSTGYGLFRKVKDVTNHDKEKH